MPDEPSTSVREAEVVGPSKSLSATPAVQAPPAARGWSSIEEQTRNRILFAIFVALLVLYPLIDRSLGIGRMGSMNPILIFTLLALGLNIVVGFAGLLDLGYAAFFAIGGYTVAFLTSPQSPLPVAYHVDFWVALPLSFAVAALF